MNSQNQYASRVEGDELQELLGRVDTRRQRARQRIEDAKKSLEEKARDTLRESFFDVLGASQAQRQGIENIMNSPMAAHEVLMLKKAGGELIDKVRSTFGSSIPENTTISGLAERSDIPTAVRYDGVTYGDAENVVERGADVPEDSAINFNLDALPEDTGIGKYVTSEGQAEDTEEPDLSGVRVEDKDEIGNFVTAKGQGIEDAEQPDLSRPANVNRVSNVARPRERSEVQDTENLAQDQEQPITSRGGEIEMQDFNAQAATREYAEPLEEKEADPTEQEVNQRGFDYDVDDMLHARNEGGGAVNTEQDEQIARGMQADELRDSLAKSETLQDESDNLMGRDLIDSLPRKSIPGEDDLGDAKSIINSLPRKAIPEAEEAGEGAEIAGDVEEVAEGLSAVPGIGDILGGILAAGALGFQAYEGVSELISAGKENDKASVERAQAANQINKANSLSSSTAPPTGYSQAGRYAAPVVSRAGEFY